MAKIIYNDVFPFGSMKAMTIWPFIFAKGTMKDDDENHENIHWYQQLEVLVVATVIDLALVLCLDLSWWWMVIAPFVYFIEYGLEYVIRLFAYGNHKEAYRNIATEQEAYMNEKDFNYLRKERNPFAWVKYITKKTYKRK